LLALNVAKSLSDLSALKSVAYTSAKSIAEGNVRCRLTTRWRLCFEFRKGDATSARKARRSRSASGLQTQLSVLFSSADHGPSPLLANVDVDVEINITHAGWFFGAERFFFSVARYLDKAALDDPFGPPGGDRGVGGR